MTAVKEKTKKKNLILDKRSYLIFAIVGVLLILLLLLLQTRFKEDMRLSDDGFAIISGTVTDSLNAAPYDSEASISEVVSLYSFSALDYFYTQNQNYYLGAEEKTEIDTAYPLYMKNGNVLQLIDNSAVLFDEDYEQAVTYRGLYLQGGHTFNINGEQADPMKFLFLELNNGNHINLALIEYEDNGREYDINENSIIHFERDYFSYYEYEDGTLLYKYKISVKDDTILKVDGVEHTYEELLKLLRLRSDLPQLDIDDELETTTPVEEETTTIVEEESTTEHEKETSSKLETEETTSEEEETSSSEEETTIDQDGDDNDKVSPGVRPDHMRPDKDNNKDDEEEPEKVPDYVKPIVTVTTPFEANVYRLIAEIEVKDPVKRIDKKKMIQFEVYEIGPKGKETLVTRGYVQGTGKVILGGGGVKPETDYRIVGYFTYNDEYNKSQVEQLGEWNVTTKGIDTLGIIKLLHEQNVTYSDRIELENVGYAEGSDEEAVYGINPTAGITLIVRDEDGKEVLTKKVLPNSDVTNFKRQARLIVSTLGVLAAKSTYEYEFVFKDFFDNTLKLENAKGKAITCNNTPKASISVENNEIADVQLKVSINDIDDALIPAEGKATDCDIYLILARKGYGVSSLTDEEIITYYKMKPSDYTYSEEEGINLKNAIVTFTELDLDETMYAYVYCDYDLQNNAGPQRFKEVGMLRFTTSGFASLGKVYVDVAFDEDKLTYNSMPITYTLNTSSTNSELSKLIVGFETDVVAGAGDDKRVYTTLGFDKNHTEQDGRYKYQMFRNEEGLTYTARDLDSMTTYELEPRVYLEYRGKIYDNVSVVLSKKNFKTLRKPAEVIVDDLLFAAGTIIFDATIVDKDEAIIGPLGDKVIVNLYTTAGEFVTATRIKKNQDEPVTIEFKNLDVNKNYELRFMAVEYNEGYSNASFESNKVLKTVKIMGSVRLDGTIKLQEINKIQDDDKHFNSVFKVVMSDEEHYLSGKKAIPYYVAIEKNGELVATNEYYVNNEPVSTVYSTNYEYMVDAGDNTYKMTLYVVISGRTMVLDTLEFTSERTVKGFSTAYEMITLLKEDPNGKFVATNSFVINSNSWNFRDIVDPGDVDALTETDLETLEINLDEGISGAGITSIFDGEIDFQGFTLTHKYYADGHSMFLNIGANGEITNMVYKVYLLNDARIYDEGFICYRNYGRISDIYIEFAGALNVIDNKVFGYICRHNCSTGIIENFVVNNNPGVITIKGVQEKLVNISAYQHFGTIASDNYGIVRYGYVYGDNIIAASSGTDIERRIGGIIGTNQPVGKVYSVYSLINVDEELRNGSGDKTYGYRYGAVCGYSAGVLSSLYSAAESRYKENKNSNIEYYQKSPVVGDSAQRDSNVFFYSPSGFKYKYAGTSETGALKNVKEIDINNLYDPGWQRAILTDRFNIQMVEVGYYPHILLNEDLPVQKNIALPDRVLSSDIEISRANVITYFTKNKGTADETDAALVEFVFSNREGLEIVKLDIDNLSVELDLASAKTEDGYTTIDAIVYNPQTFNSEYTVRKISFYKKNVLKENTVDYVLYADFYRGIYTTEDWYNYVVKNVAEGIVENVRIMKDLDFAGVPAENIMVTKSFEAKLDGNNKKMLNIDLQRGLQTNSYWTVRNLFTAYPSIDYSGEVKNLTIENYYAGGVYEVKTATTRTTYVARYGAVFRNVKGTVDGVNLINANIKSFEQVGGIAAYVDAGGEIKNCTVQGINITYLEPDNQNIDASIGGIAGYVYHARITHCVATGVNILAEEMKASNGIGGVIGYATNSAIDTICAEGSIETRGLKTGGAIGDYNSTSSAVTCVKNTMAKVDIISYTDSVGGLIGQISITQESISERNNFSGIAFGNVYVANPNSTHITHTIGSNIGKNAKFFGTNKQLVNGMADVDISKDEYAQTVVVGLLGFEDLFGKNAENVYEETIGFDNVYDYSLVEKGYLPQMYKLDSNELLPVDPILINTSIGYNVEVTNVYTDTDRKIITVEIKNPQNYKITGIDIQKLKVHYADITGNANVHSSIDKASDYDGGYTRIYLKYDDEQDYYLDSYVMDKIYFYNVENSYEMTMDEVKAGSGKEIELETFSRINATLYKDITSVEDWNNIAVRELQGNIYENYRVIANLDFSSVQVSHNLKIGRLEGASGLEENIVIRNIELDGTGKNLISRLNSGIANLTFVDCSIKSKNANCTGLIGVNNGFVNNCKFENIEIIPETKDMDEAGIIAHQNGGNITNVTLDDIEVLAYASNKTGIDYVGGLFGKLTDGSTISNVIANNIVVTGQSTVGGLAGLIYVSQISDVVMTNIKVTSHVNYAGGLAGRLGTDSNARSGAVNDVKISGTPTYDVNGYVNGSTTIIETSTGSYVGGIAGQNYHKSGSNAELSVHKSIVDGVVIKGYASYIGGVFGYNYSDVCHLYCKNSLITTADTTNIGYNRVGGVIGYEEYGNVRYLTADKITINSKNHSQVGGVIGGNNSSGMYYCSADNSIINASSKTNGTWIQVGGVVGYQKASSLTYIGSLNTIINAETMDCVGGLVGQLGESITSNVTLQRSFNIYGYDEYAYSQYGISTTKYTAAAKDIYSIKGYNYVGGLIGKQCGGSVQFNYSNGNIIAAAGQVAGGAIGYYGNEFIPLSNGGKSYSNTQLYRNYFAGTVSVPNGYAGGIIGRTGILVKGQGTDATGAMTGSGTNGSRIKNVNSNANERDKLYGNIVFAASIEGAPGKTQCFAGDDKDYKFAGKNNALWEGTIVNGVYTCNLVYNNNYAYDYWNPTNKYTGQYPLTTDGDPLKIALFKHSDLDGSIMAKNSVKHNRAAMFYRNMGWSLPYKEDEGDYVNRAFLWAVYIGNVCKTSSGVMKNLADKAEGDIVTGLKNSLEVGGVDPGTYLPQVRNTTTSKYANDYCMKMQNRLDKLPVPKDDSCVRQPLQNLSAESAPENVTYGYVYASDVDKINVEFSNDLVGRGYFTLKVNGIEVTKQIITERTYTYSYNFKDIVEIEYGVNNVPKETVTYEADDLMNTAIVYKDSYYYISEEGIVTEDYTISGKYINLMNGKALDANGYIVDVVTRNIVEESLSESIKITTTPLWKFNYSGYDIYTFGRYSRIVSERSDVIRDAQVFVYNNRLVMIDGNLDTNKTDVLLYSMNGTDYLTVLGKDGFMVDLYNEDLNLPKTVDNKAIVKMTNTINANVPYVILQYSNGGMLCYNYATGSVIFDKTIADDQSLFDYALEFFSKDEQSKYAGISQTYKTNSILASSIDSSKDLELIIGNSKDKVTDNEYSSGDSAYTSGDEGMADEDLTKLPDSDVEIGTTKDFVDEEDDTVSEEITSEETTTNSNTEEITSGESETTEETSSTVDSTENTEESGNESVTTDSTEETKQNESDGNKYPYGEDAKFMTVYNSNTGVYEIVNVEGYLSDNSYVSENVKLGVENFANYGNGFAQTVVEENEETGIIFYIVPILMIFMIFAGVEVYISYRRSKNKEQ